MLQSYICDVGREDGRSRIENGEIILEECSDDEIGETI